MQTTSCVPCPLAWPGERTSQDPTVTSRTSSTGPARVQLLISHTVTTRNPQTSSWTQPAVNHTSSTRDPLAHRPILPTTHLLRTSRGVNKNSSTRPIIITMATVTTTTRCSTTAAGITATTTTMTATTDTGRGRSSTSAGDGRNVCKGNLSF